MIATEKELQYFAEVYKTKHFTRSAIKLGISQPTLTQSIIKLEKKTGTPLFHRTKQGCIPTPAANMLYQHVTRLQEHWQHITEELAHTSHSLVGTFRVGCHPSVGSYTLPRFFELLATSAPQIEIRLHHDLSRNITEKIIGYELDLGFVVNPIKHRDLVLTPIGKDRVSFWKPKKKTHHPFIFANLSLNQVQSLLQKCHSSRFSRYRVIDTSSLELTRTLIGSGAGIGILPERVATADPNPLELYDPRLPHFPDEIFLAYRADTLKSLAAKTLLKAARAVLHTT